MREKIVQQLQRSYGEQGLSEELLQGTASYLAEAVGSEEEIAPAVERLAGIMGLLSAELQRASVRASEPSEPPATPAAVDSGFEAYRAAVEERFAAVQEQLQSLKAATEVQATQRASAQREAIVDAIARDLGFDADLKQLAALRLTPDMDERAIDRSMCEAKKLFVSKGMMADDLRVSQRSDALRSRAEEWVEAQHKRITAQM